MKLRLRSLESKETLKIEVPNSCTWQQLQDTIYRAISSSSTFSPSSVRLSLNRKDEIRASLPDESIQSLGITGGDLIFYTPNPTAFYPQTHVHKPTPQETNFHDGASVQESTEIHMSDAPSITETEKSPALEGAEAETVDMVHGSVEAVGKSIFQPLFLERMLSEALGGDVIDFKLLVFAVDAVFLESGFVRADGDWPSLFASTVSMRYSLPEILTNSSGSGAIITVNLKFQTLGHLVNVYGSLSDVAGSGLHRVCLDKYKFARPLGKMLKNSESNGSLNNGVDDNCETEIFELWKMAKDRLALPLLIDLCEKAGLDPPPCFMCLPTELKLKILEYLPGVDLAKVATVCKEVRYLSSNNELWKLKFEEEFGQVGSGGKVFKEMFALHWDSKKKSQQRFPLRPNWPLNVRFFPVSNPNRFGIPSVVGGDYDRLPAFGPPFPSYLPRRTFLPPCHRRGFNN